MEEVLPRKLNTPADLFKLNPYLLENREDYDDADLEGINKVS